MNIPHWISELRSHDELVLYFPYTGNTVWAEFIEIDAMMGHVQVQYVDRGRVKTDFLNSDNYTLAPDSFENWYAYKAK